MASSSPLSSVLVAFTIRLVNKHFHSPIPLILISISIWDIDLPFYSGHLYHGAFLVELAVRSLTLIIRNIQAPGKTYQKGISTNWTETSQP